MLLPPVPNYDPPDWPATGTLPAYVAEQYVASLARYFERVGHLEAIRCTVEALRLLEPIWMNDLPAGTTPRVAASFPDALAALDHSYSPDTINQYVHLVDNLPRGNLARRVGSVLFYFQIGLHLRSSWPIHLAVTVQKAGDVATRTPYGFKFYDDWRALCAHMDGRSLFD